MNESNLENVRVIASDKNWIESNAVAQLKGTARLPGMQLAVGLPDLHPGKGGPVGAAFVTQSVLYPHLIGNDIGCGMGLWQSELERRKLKLDRWSRKLGDLDAPWDGDREAWLESFRLEPSEQDRALGTIGGGNHFAELQEVESVECPEAFKRLGLEADRLLLLVHSGSRGLGREILTEHHAAQGHAGLLEDSPAALRYASRHDYAVAWARASRALIAKRFLEALGSGNRAALDLPHNYLAREELVGKTCWIHRKGSNPSDRGAVAIPGSRGALTFLVEPLGNQERNARSLCHGAGRKWNRTDCKARLRERYDEASLVRTAWGGHVVCEDRDLLYEEAPQAYKNIEVVVQDLVDAGLVRVIARLRPLLTYKVRRAAS
ncbi:MAG: RNA ligase RtcB family protein [Planctomycetes bacterium]|nr:RNA ligase RtcB family protein [Planctomycetota bacterium]